MMVAGMHSHKSSLQITLRPRALKNERPMGETLIGRNEKNNACYRTAQKMRSPGRHRSSRPERRAMPSQRRSRKTAETLSTFPAGEGRRRTPRSNSKQTQRRANVRGHDVPACPRTGFRGENQGHRRQVKRSKARTKSRNEPACDRQQHSFPAVW
jgi:hypothetical protein